MGEGMLQASFQCEKLQMKKRIEEILRECFLKLCFSIWVWIIRMEKGISFHWANRCHGIAEKCFGNTGLPFAFTAKEGNPRELLLSQLWEVQECNSNMIFSIFTLIVLCRLSLFPYRAKQSRILNHGSWRKHTWIFAECIFCFRVLFTFLNFSSLGQLLCRKSVSSHRLKVYKIFIRYV